MGAEFKCGNCGEEMVYRAGDFAEEIAALRKRAEELTGEGQKWHANYDDMFEACCAEIRLRLKAERERDEAKQYADEYKKAYLAELDGIKKHMDKSFDVAIRIIENWGGPTTTTKTMREIHARAEKAEQERDKLAEGYERRRQELDAQYAEIKKLQADLDAALDWIKGVGGPMGRGGYPTDRVLALLEKRREERRG